MFLRVCHAGPSCTLDHALIIKLTRRRRKKIDYRQNDLKTSRLEFGCVEDFGCPWRNLLWGAPSESFNRGLRERYSPKDSPFCAFNLIALDKTEARVDAKGYL